LAIQEPTAWKQANLKEVAIKESIALPNLAHLPPPRTPECQIDASWHLDDNLSGHGWVLVY